MWLDLGRVWEVAVFPPISYPLIAAFFPVGFLMFVVAFVLIACGIVCLCDRR